MASLTPTPARQAAADKEKSKTNRVTTLADLSPEERAKKIAEVEAVDRSRAKARAEAAKRGKR